MAAATVYVRVNDFNRNYHHRHTGSTDGDESLVDESGCLCVCIICTFVSRPLLSLVTRGSCVERFV